MRTLQRKLGIHLQFSITYHPQIDKKTKVINQSLESLLRSLVKNNIHDRDLIFPQAKFAYNHSISQNTRCSHFQVVYGQNPWNSLDLIPLPTSANFSGDAEEMG